MPDATRAAEGFSRRSFTVAEVLRMEKHGIIHEDENYELIEGEIVPMQSKTHVHELIKSSLTFAIVRTLPDHLWLGIESSIYLSERTFLEPDLVIYPRGIKLEAVKGTDIILAIEVGLTTLAKDLRLKAAIYAKYGVREVWVIDAKRRKTHIHQGPSENGWGSIEIQDQNAVLNHPALPGFAVRLADI